MRQEPLTGTLSFARWSANERGDGSTRRTSMKKIRKTANRMKTGFDVLQLSKLQGNRGGLECEGRTCQNRLALLPEMWRQNANTDPAAYRAGGLSPVLSEVQIRLCGSLSQQKIGRNQNARRLDAVQSGKPVCTAFSFLRVGQPEYQSIMKNIGGTHYEKQCVGRHRPAK